MGQLKGETAYFIGQAPEYEARGEHIVGHRNGAEYVMPVAVAQKIVARLNRAIDQCLEGRGRVIPLPARHR